MSADGSNSTLPSQELLVEFLASSHADAEGAFEALCAAHPSQAETLRRLYAAHRKLQSELAVFGAVRRGPSHSAPSS